MFTRIARKEFTDLVRDGRFRWSAAIVTGLLTVAMAAGFTAHRAARADRDAAQAQMQSWWYTQPAKNAHSAAHYGLWAFKPAPSLAFFDRGVDGYAGTAAWLEAHKQNDFRFRPAMDATAAQRFGEWTASAVLQQLVPLLIIVLAFGAFAGERELGTLRQVASLGVPTRTLIIGKALGVSAALSVVLVPAALLGAGALLLGTSGVSADLGRFALLSVVYLGWFALVLSATLVVSLLARSSRAALVVLLSLWAFNGLVAPRVASAIASTLRPTPSRVAFIADVDRKLAQGLDGHSPAGVRAEQLERRLLQKYGVKTKAELPINFEAAAMQASEEHGNEVFDDAFGRLYRTYRAQVDVQQWAALAAPLVAVRLLSMGIAGTDVEQHRAFATAAETYRRGIERTMNGWLERNTVQGKTFQVTADSSLWNEVPPFSYTMPSLDRALAPYGTSVAVLVVWMLALTGWLTTRHRLMVD